MKLKPTHIIAIDPDVEKSGVACLDVINGTLMLASLTFDRLLPFLQAKVSSCTNRALQEERRLSIFVEAGWLNRSNWHYSRGDSPAVIAAKGRAQGRNEQVGKCILSFLELLHRNLTEYDFKAQPPYFTYEAVKPLRKMWQGQDKKITHEELKRVCGDVLQAKRTNQEERDAALLAWTEANLPMQIDMTNVFGIKSYLKLNL